MTTEQITLWFMRHRAIQFPEAQKLAESVIIRRKERDDLWANPFRRAENNSPQRTLILHRKQK